MVQLSHVTLGQLKQFQDDLSTKSKSVCCLEEAARQYTHALYEMFSESVILARFFATLPFSQLPETNRTFVMELANSAGIQDLIKNHTLVLSLLGTSGVKPDWNDRHQSRGHIGIPLVSSDFIDAIPMMSRLLKQLGLGLDWIDNNDTELVLKTIGNLSGVFHVYDAKTEVDSQGRKIITAGDFVRDENVHTVFGIGGGYLGSSMFFTTIIFLREPLERDIVERFLLQTNKFKTATMHLISENKIFCDACPCV